MLSPKSKFCPRFPGVLWPSGHSFADGIVVPGGCRRNEGRGAADRLRGLLLDPAGINAQGVMRQLDVVSLPQQDAECPVTITTAARRCRESPRQERERAVDLRVVMGWGDDLVDQIARDPARDQPLIDPSGSPLVEHALVLGVQPGEPLVV